MKKGKVISMPTSVDAQIRTRVRNLPIGRCYINSNWRQAQLANVIVTRKHVNDNITFGFYLVDLMLLGVKDCFFDFNVSHVELEERLFNVMPGLFVECDYELAHNIIYEGVGFAEDFGFEPVKSFTKTGIYILEEDSDDIPQMDIPLGENGVPMVYINSENDMQREIAILEKTAGPGNYIVYDEDNDEDFDDEDDEDDENNDWNYEEIVDDIYTMGVDNYIAEYGNQFTPVQRLAVIDVAYDVTLGILDVNNFKLYDLIIEDNRFDTDLKRLPGLDNYLDQLQSIVDKTVDDKDAALSELEALIAEHPDNIDLDITHICLLYDMDRVEQADQLTLQWYDRVPNHYVIRLFYARWLVKQERFDDLFKLFGKLPGLDALTKENLPFTELMVAEFCACYVLAWLSKGNIKKAEPYYLLLHDLEQYTPIVRDAFTTMMKKKIEAIEKKMPELKFEN